jgi:hypothetical protein
MGCLPGAHCAILLHTLEKIFQVIPVLSLPHFAALLKKGSANPAKVEFITQYPLKELMINFGLLNLDAFFWELDILSFFIPVGSMP